MSNEFEAMFCVSDLIAQAGSEFSQQIAAFARGCFGVKLQLPKFGRKQYPFFSIKRQDVPFGVLNLPRNAREFSDSTLIRN